MGNGPANSANSAGFVMDFSGADEQRDFGALIPEGQFVRVQLKWDRGGENVMGMHESDNGLFKHAKPPSTLVMIQPELTVTHGPYARMKIFEYWGVFGGEMDEAGNSKSGIITRARIRALLEALHNIDPSDKSPAAQAKKMTRSFTDLNGCCFPIRVDIQPGQDGFRDSNKIAIIVTPNMPEYIPVMQGHEVEPKPSRSSSGTRKNPAAAASGIAGWASTATVAPPVAPPPPTLPLAPPAPPAPPVVAAPLPPAAPVIASPPPGAHIDESGRFWWDGQGWQPMPPAPALAPPAPPPPPSATIAAPPPPPPPAVGGSPDVPAWVTNQQPG